MPKNKFRNSRSRLIKFSPAQCSGQMSSLMKSAATITERQKKKATKELCKQKARVAGGGGRRCPHCTV
jgi:hypothetical protein